MPAAHAIDLVGASAARLSWAAASGPVAGYLVYAARNGAPAPGAIVAATARDRLDVQVAGIAGDSVVVSVAAYAADGTVGPLSAPSEVIRFLAAATPSPGSGGATLPPVLAANEALVYIASQVDDRVDVQAYRADGSVAGSFTLVAEPGSDPRALADPRPARCDVDGDGVDDLVMGFGVGSNGRIEVMRGAIDGFAQLATLHVPNAVYATENGETFPACGDVDGDGADEIVAGRGLKGGGYLDVFDDAIAGYRWRNLIGTGWFAYRIGNGETHPALGDIDGDGLDELVVGFADGGDGTIQLIDDASLAHRRIPTPQGNGLLAVAAPNGSDGAIHPVIADVDGDGAGEIVLGFGAGGAGLLLVLEDVDPRPGGVPVGTPFATPSGNGWVQAGFAPYNAADGAVVPVAIDLDGDGLDELVLGFRGEDRIELVEDAAAGFAPAVPGGFVQQPVWGLGSFGPALVR